MPPDAASAADNSRNRVRRQNLRLSRIAHTFKHRVLMLRIVIAAEICERSAFRNALNRALFKAGTPATFDEHGRRRCFVVGGLAERCYLYPDTSMNQDLAFAPPARPLDVATDFERISGVLVAQRSPIAALALGRGREILLSRLAVGSAVDDLQRFVEAEPKYFPSIGRWLVGRKIPRSDPRLRLPGSTSD